MLPEIELAGQQRLAGSRVLIIGLGGLGSPVALYLATAGVGHLVLVDDDKVELSNLQRQILHSQETLDQLKAISAVRRLEQMNPRIKLTPVPHRLTPTELKVEVALSDVVVDCSDNFPTRFALNRACVAARKPLVSGAAVRFEGQLTVFLPGREHSPCYHCLYQETDEESRRCAENGVFAPLVGIIGSLQAAETLKVLLNWENVCCGRLVLFDAKTLEWRNLKLRRDPGCPVCGNENPSDYLP